MFMVDPMPDENAVAPAPENACQSAEMRSCRPSSTSSGAGRCGSAE